MMLEVTEGQRSVAEEMEVKAREVSVFGQSPDAVNLFSHLIGAF